MSRGLMIDKAFRDPDIFPGQPVEVMAQACPPDVRKPVHARFVGVSTSSPDKGWVVSYTFRMDGWHGVVMLVPLWGLRVSQRPAEPPPLPKWARLKAAG